MEIQNNVSKAREIARECVYCFADAENGALKMAEWKDQQFREYLEKKYDAALNAWDDWAAYDPKTAASWRVKTLYIREIINELFPEIEEQDNSDREE